MLLILSAKPKSASGKGTQEKIKKLLKRDSIPFVYAHFDDVQIIYNSDGVECIINGESISAFDTLYIRLMGRNRAVAYCVAQEVASNGGRVIDRYAEDPAVLSGYKLGELYRYAKAGISIPKTVAYNASIKKTVPVFEKELSYPFVVKSLSDSQGRGVYLVASERELEDAISKLKADKKQYIAQEYIGNLFEYRIVVFGGKSRVVEKKTRTRKDEFRNNVSLGAKEEFLDMDSVPVDIISIAEAAAQAGGVDVAGVDVIYDDPAGKAYVLEVNLAPQMSFDVPESKEVEELVKFIS